MKNIYEYFLLALPKENQEMINSFVEDCKKISAYQNCMHIIKKYNLSSSKYVDVKILNINFNNVDCNMYINHEGNDNNPRYTGGFVCFSLFSNIDNQKKLKIYFESEIIYKNEDNRHSIELSIQDNNDNELFKTSFVEYHNSILIRKKMSDTLKEKSNFGEFIGKNELVMKTLLQNFQNPESFIDTIFLLTDIEVKDNYFVQELSKASLLIKYNHKNL